MIFHHDIATQAAGQRRGMPVSRFRSLENPTSTMPLADRDGLGWMRFGHDPGRAPQSLQLAVDRPIRKLRTARNYPAGDKDRALYCEFRCCLPGKQRRRPRRKRKRNLVNGFRPNGQSAVGQLIPRFPIRAAAVTAFGDKSGAGVMR
ncbi:hypothetical protein [Pararhodobacter aggregans]